jgi:hypothetical protein
MKRTSIALAVMAGTLASVKSWNIAEIPPSYIPEIAIRLAAEDWHCSSTQGRQETQESTTWLTSSTQQQRLKSFSVTLPFPLTASTVTPYQQSIVKNATNQFPSRGALQFPAARRARNARVLSN